MTVQPLGWEHRRGKLHLRIGDQFSFCAWLPVQHEQPPSGVAGAEGVHGPNESELQEAREVLLSHAWLTASASTEELGVECATDGRNGRLRCLRLDPQSSGIDNAQPQQKEEKDDRERYSGSVASAVAESECREGRRGHADGADERAQLEKEKHRLLANERFYREQALTEQTPEVEGKGRDKSKLRSGLPQGRWNTAIWNMAGSFALKHLDADEATADGAELHPKQGRGGGQATLKGRDSFRRAVSKSDDATGGCSRDPVKQHKRPDQDESDNLTRQDNNAVPMGGIGGVGRGDEGGESQAAKQVSRTPMPSLPHGVDIEVSVSGAYLAIITGRHPLPPISVSRRLAGKTVPEQEFQISEIFRAVKVHVQVDITNPETDSAEHNLVRRVRLEGGAGGGRLELMLVRDQGGLDWFLTEVSYLLRPDPEQLMARKQALPDRKLAVSALTPSRARNSVMGRFKGHSKAVKLEWLPESHWRQLNDGDVFVVLMHDSKDVRSRAGLVGGGLVLGNDWHEKTRRSGAKAVFLEDQVRRYHPQPAVLADRCHLWVWIGREANPYEVHATVMWIAHQLHDLDSLLAGAPSGLVWIDWVQSGKESPEFWRHVSGPPQDGQIAGACTVVPDEVCEHLPFAQPARPPPSPPPSRGRRARVAVIGAGVAGASCAEHLATAGKDLVSVTVLEKDSWGVGGKLGVQRSKRGPFRVSPTLTFSAVGPAFRKAVDRWVNQGAAELFGSKKRLGVVDGGGLFYPYDCYPYAMSNSWNVTAFHTMAASGPKAGESISGGAYADMTQGFMWSRMLGGGDDAVKSLRRAEDELAEAKASGHMSGKELATLAHSIKNLRLSAEAARDKKSTPLSDFAFQGAHIHRQPNLVEAGARGMGACPLLFRGRHGMHSIVENMLSPLRLPHQEDGAGVRIGVEVETIDRDPGSARYVLRALEGTDGKTMRRGERGGQEESENGEGDVSVSGEADGANSRSSAGQDDFDSLSQASDISNGFEGPAQAEANILGEFDYVCICVPAPCVEPLLQDLLAPDHFILTAARDAQTVPMWTVVMEFEHPPPFAFHGAFYQPSLASDVQLTARQRERRFERELRMQRRDWARRRLRTLKRQKRADEHEKRLRLSAAGRGDEVEMLRVVEEETEDHEQDSGGQLPAHQTDDANETGEEALSDMDEPLGDEDERLDEMHVYSLFHYLCQNQRKQGENARASNAGGEKGAYDQFEKDGPGLLKFEKARLALGDLGYSEEEVEAFVDGVRISSALGHRPGTRPNTAEEQDQERFLQAREFELRSFSEDWPLFPASRGMPLEWKHALHELREISFDTFRAGMRNVAHTRQRLDEQHAKMKRLVLEREGNVDPVEAQLDHAISSIFDITEEHKATREAAALQRTAKHSGVAHKASASQAHDVNNFGQNREETHEESAKDGPAAAWIVFTNATWSSQNAWRSSPEVANLVSERAMHILCRGQDEADTQRIMRANMPYRIEAFLWPEAALSSTPASLQRGKAAQDAARQAPETRHCLFDPASGLGVAADWCVDPTVEGAWVSGRSLAASVIVDVSCNIGRGAALVNRELEDTADDQFRQTEDKWKRTWALRHQDRTTVLLQPVIHRWAFYLPAAKALRWWYELALHMRRLKAIFRIALVSHDRLCVEKIFSSWEEIICEKRAGQLMSKVIDMLQGMTLQDAFSYWKAQTMLGAGWQMMLALRKQRDRILLRRITAKWLVLVKEDKSLVLLPLVLRRRRHQLLQRMMQAWAASLAAATAPS